MIFFPDRQIALPPKGIDEVFFKTDDGETLHGWWMHSSAKNKTVLFFHGNGGDVAGLDYIFHIFRKLSVNGLVFDYRGYGKSTGEIKKEKNLYSDADAAWNFLTSNGAPENQIIIWGQSLGGGVAADIAQNKRVSAIILDSTFYSMEEMAGREFPYLPTKLLLKYRFRTDKKLKNIIAPLLVIHSTEDQIIPFDQGMKIYQAASGKKDFLEVTGSHIGAFFDCEEKYLTGINSFLTADFSLRSE